MNSYFYHGQFSSNHQALTLIAGRSDAIRMGIQTNMSLTGPKITCSYMRNLIIVRFPTFNHMSSHPESLSFFNMAFPTDYSYSATATCLLVTSEHICKDV